MMKECSEGVEERLKNSGIFPASDAPKSGIFETAANPTVYKIWIVALILAIAYMIAGSD